MALCLRAVLDHPVMRRADPVVPDPRADLDRPVRWVHSSEIYEIAPLLRGDELLLTTGLGLAGRDSAARCRYIAELASAGVAGVALEIGRTFPEVPADVLDAAAEAGLPLVVLRGVVPFVEITEAVNAAIVDSSVARLRRVNEIVRVLSGVLARGAGVDELTRTLAELTGRPVVLARVDGGLAAWAGTDAPARVLAAPPPVPGWSCAGRCGADSSWARAGPRRRIPTLVGRRAGARGRGGRARRAGVRPGAAAARRSRRLGRSRAPRAGRGPAGRHAAAARGGRAADGLRSGPDGHLGLGDRDPGPAGSGPRGDRAARGLRACGGRGLVTDGPGAAYAIVALDRPTHVAELTARLGAPPDAPAEGPGPVAALGPVVRDLARLGHSLRAARDTLRLARRVHTVRGTPVPATVIADDWALERVLERLTPEELADLVEDQLGPLLAADATRGTGLVVTLAAYLDSGCSETATGGVLFLRRQSVHQRLAMIESLLRVSPDDPARQGPLRAALVARDLLATRGPVRS
ncbi:PucR family transcriptional regulator [Embleya sp. NBC_00896]|uniref:PucR family transcriptional regulator n=1 Tax=Embleya sp. NBC_00896 TaxID=2975961 RepID=UPI00386F9AF9|nr:PucR family transcriptional regulator [Embleya sp. NBC_00896]